MSSRVLTSAAAALVPRFIFESAASSASEPSYERRHPEPAAPPPNSTIPLGDAAARTTELEASFQHQLAAARHAAYLEGETSGRSQAQAAVQPVIDRLAQSVSSLAALKPQLRQQLQEEAVQLSLAIARRILRREVSVDSNSLQALVQAAYERIARQEITRVVVHPAQAAAIQAALRAITTRTLDIHPDPTREQGTLIFETTRGALDASVDSQLREIELGLTDRLHPR